MLRSAVLLIFLLSIVQNSFAKCEYILALSRTSSTTLYSQADVQNTAFSFCKTYKETSGNSSDPTFQFAYESLSFGGGNKSTSMHEVAAKYCGDFSDDQIRARAYQNYAQQISPLAYASLNQCLAAESELKVSIEQTDVVPTQFSATVLFKPTSASVNSTRVSATPSPGVSCAWDGQKKAAINIGSTSQAVLTCKKSDPGILASVKIARLDGEGSSTIPWPATDKNGIPLDLLSRMQTQISALDKRLSNVDVQQGQISWGTDENGNLLQPIEYAGSRRGYIERRVKFARPFPVKPTVMIAIDQLDVGNDKNLRARVIAKDADETGFTVSVETWATTRIFSISGSWIAISK